MLSSLPILWDADEQVNAAEEPDAFGESRYLVAAVRWLTWTHHELPETLGHLDAGSAHVATVREMTRAFGRLDDLFGGGHARDAVVRYLRREVSPVLREGRHPPLIRPVLFGAVAELVRLAGWMAYDTGRHGLGQRYLVHALRIAMEAGDDAVGAEVLAGMSHQAVHVGRPVLGLDLARAAHGTALRTGIGRLIAEASVMEAHCQARRGDEQACTGALGRAERAFERADRDQSPEWLSYFDEAYLAAKFAHCFRDLGQVDLAEGYALRSLNMDGRYVRGRTFNTALLASIKAQQGEVDQACALGSQALDLATGLRSRRTVEYIDDLRRRLRPHGNTKAVRTFEEEASALLPQV